jgi:hypothetical protein
MNDILLWVYIIGNLATFGKLTFFDDYVYNWWNWIIVLPINEFLAMIWPLYWCVILPLSTALGWVTR